MIDTKSRLLQPAGLGFYESNPRSIYVKPTRRKVGERGEGSCIVERVKPPELSVC